MAALSVYRETARIRTCEYTVRPYLPNREKHENFGVTSSNYYNWYASVYHIYIESPYIWRRDYLRTCPLLLWTGSLRLLRTNTINGRFARVRRRAEIRTNARIAKHRGDYAYACGPLRRRTPAGRSNYIFSSAFKTFESTERVSHNRRTSANGRLAMTIVDVSLFPRWTPK